MAEYIKFSDKQIEAANAVDLEAFLLSRGERLLKSGHEKRMASDHSITIRGNEWYDHACGQGGYPIDFVMRYDRLSFQNAVSTLLDGGASMRVQRAAKTIMRKAFALPEENTNMHRVFAYLVNQRCISREIVAEFVRRKMIYEESTHHNVVFVGYDENGMPKHAHCRSTSTYTAPFRINLEGCDSAYSFHFDGTNDCLLVFEAPIDMLSYISLISGDWKENNYVALCGTSKQAMLKMLELHPAIRRVTLCLDSDEAGQKATERLKAECHERGIAVNVAAPRNKDWNDDLCLEKESSMKMT